MPHTSHKKTKRHTKRAEVIGEDGWTRVTTTNQLQRQPRPLSATTALTELELPWYGGPGPSVPVPDTTIEQLIKQYKKFEGQWLRSRAYRELEKCFKEIGREIFKDVDKCFVFGTGSFCGHTRGWIERFDVSLYQLAVFVSIVGVIEKVTGARPLSYAQEPVYNDFDVELLSFLQVTTVVDPTGIRSITPSSFIYLPYAELEVELSTLSRDPAIALIVSKLESYWRNAKGEACTDRIRVGTREISADEEDGDTGKLLHEMTDEELRRNPETERLRDEIEKGLQICEDYKKDKAIKSLPALDNCDAFTDMYLFYRQAQAD